MLQLMQRASQYALRTAQCEAHTGRFSRHGLAC
ncbi:hypothetical protein O164_18155 [Pseudomonas taiwanensis SJ9]|uniref:Uncharacterized protein n=2 Tax=Pseudomonas TaxID=286 RepID=A0A3G1DGG1_PSEAI|nr:Hypothetical protein [Pseudomonas aeruginosa]ESW38365.1 hypothetical protein O164_18155 [Pseudomonas taiwanensis SJ9]